jgi:predicted RNase H-like nuclease (RuvC/YqgF family)
LFKAKTTNMAHAEDPTIQDYERIILDLNKKLVAVKKENLELKEELEQLKTDQQNGS